jgi:hypothetical protein
VSSPWRFRSSRPGKDAGPLTGTPCSSGPCPSPCPALLLGSAPVRLRFRILVAHRLYKGNELRRRDVERFRIRSVLGYVTVEFELRRFLPRLPLDEGCHAFPKCHLASLQQVKIQEWGPRQRRFGDPRAPAFSTQTAVQANPTPASSCSPPAWPSWRRPSAWWTSCAGRALRRAECPVPGPSLAGGSLVSLVGAFLDLILPWERTRTRSSMSVACPYCRYGHPHP